MKFSKIEGPFHHGVSDAEAVPKATDSNAVLTDGMLTSTVLAVAVSAIATAEKAKAVGSLTMAAVPSPWALPP